MNSPIKDLDSQVNQWVDRLKVYAIDTLVYDIKSFFYKVTFREAFKYGIAIIFMTVIPTLVVLSVISSVYTSYLYYHRNLNSGLWFLITLTGFSTAFLFFFLAKKFILDRSSKFIKMPEPTNPAEIFVSTIISELKKEQTEIIERFNK